MDLNNCSFTGRLTRAIELKNTATTTVGNFTIAVSCFKSTMFLPCKRFDKNLDKLASYLNKGQQVAVSGNLEEETWTGKDGNEKKRVVLTCKDIVLIGGGKKESQENFDDEVVPF